MPSTLASPASLVRSSASAEDVDLQLVGEIIDRASRDATTFPVVYQAYSDVLRDYELDVPTDTVYYHFLLKLGVLKGRTWGERWDQWLADHPDAMKASIGRLDVSDRTFSKSVSSRLSQVRERVPFLADAASEGDETYEAEDEEDARNFLENLHQIPTDTETSRSLVGYTPSHSIDTFQPPERTSTPVPSRSRSRSQRHITPPVPPYTPSESSYLTPERRQVPSHPHSARQSISTSPVQSELTRAEEVVAAEQVEAALLEMEGKAIAFYQTGLVGRCWENWLRQADWVTTTSAQVRQARTNILLRQTLRRWQALHRHHLGLPGTADQHRTHHLMSSALAKWRSALKNADLERKAKSFSKSSTQRLLATCWIRWSDAAEKARRRRWEEEMNMRESTMMERSSSRLIRNTFTKWKGRFFDVKATTFHDRTLLQDAFSGWRTATSQSRTLQIRLEAYERQKDRLLVADAFARWKRRTRLAAAEAVISDRVHNRLRRKCLSQWKVRSSMLRKAKLFDKRRVLNAALVKWEDVTSGVKILRGAAHRYRLQRDAELVRVAFTTWAAVERGRLLTRVRDTRLLKSTLTRWNSRQEQSRVSGDRAERFREASQTRQKQNCFLKWREALRQRHASEERATRVHDAQLVKSAFSKWQSRAVRIERDEARAIVARVFFVQREVIACWKERLARRRQLLWEVQREQQVLRNWFEIWRGKTARAQQDSAKVALLTAKFDKRLKTATLNRWTSRIVEVKAREFDVVEAFQTKLQRLAFDRWTQACVRRGESLSLMQSFMDVKQEDALHAIFVQWHQLAKRAKDRRIRAEKRAVEARERLLADTLDKWRGALRARELQPQVVAVMLRHEDALLFRVFDHWKARSQRLPAIAFESKRVKQLAWKMWTDALPRRRQANEAAALEKKRLLGVSMRVWREKFTSRVVQRAAARHRNFTGLGSITRVRPSTSINDDVTTRGESSTQTLAPPDTPLSVVARRRMSSIHTMAPRNTIPDGGRPTHARLRSELASSTSTGKVPGSDSRSLSPTSERGSTRRGSELYQALAGKVGSRSGRT